MKYNYQTLRDMIYGNVGQCINSLENSTFSFVLDYLQDFIIDFDVYLPKYGFNLQREYTWNRVQESSFIKHLIVEGVVPQVTVIKIAFEDRSKDKIEVIDGKHRIMAIQRFVNNEFPIIVNNEEIFYDDLDNITKRRILEPRMSVRVFYQYWSDEKPISDEQKVALFDMVNFLETPQSMEHKSRIKSILDEQIS